MGSWGGKGAFITLFRSLAGRTFHIDLCKFFGTCVYYHATTRVDFATCYK